MTEMELKSDRVLEAERFTELSQAFLVLLQQHIESKR